MAIKTGLERLFQLSENIIYTIIGLLLIITAAFIVIDVALSFFHYPSADGFIRWIIEIIDKILLMLMVIEILYTVRVSFKEHTLYAEPFLIVSMIAGIRCILVISVESAYMPEKFNQHMIEISILGVLIFIFVLAIIFLRKHPTVHPDS